MAWRTIVSGKRLLSEAPIEGEDFQLTDEDLGQDSNDFQTTEIPGDNPANGQTANTDPNNSMGDTNGGMDNGMGGGDSLGQPSDMGGGYTDPMMGEDPMPPSENETDRLKKLTLLEKYKDILELIDQARFSISCINKIDDFDQNNEDINYVKRMLDRLEEKIKDVIAYRFLNEDYKELLRLFYYFKYTLIHVTKCLEDTSVPYRENKPKRGKRKINK